MNVVITGASRGLGKAIAHLFAENGHDLVLTSRNEVALYNAVQQIMTVYPGITVKAKAFDLSVKETALAFGDWVLALQIPIDVLVNNAGLFDPGNVYNEPDGTLEHMMAVNLFSAYHVTRSVINQLIAQKSGHIFNMCSIASLKAYPNGGAYSISKYALAGFSTNLRDEMKPFGIKVTAVYPGAAFTDSWEDSGIDPKRIMQADDIAKMIYAAAQLSPQACVEEIILRPQLGDL